MKYFYLLLAIVLLGGCADSSTKGNVKDVDSQVRIEIHDNTGPIYLDPSLGFKYAQGDLAQDTSNRSDINPATDLKIPIAQGASSAATGAMEAVKNALDNSVKDNHTSSQAPAVSAPESVIKPVLKDTSQFDLEYQTDHNRLFTWLPETGSYYGGKITLEICDKTLTVLDAAKEAKGDIIWFPGTTKTGAENNNNRASVFGPLGCKTGSLILTQVE